MKLADQTKLKDTKQRRVWILLGLCKGENETSLIFIEVFLGCLLPQVKHCPLVLVETSNLLKAPQGQLTRGRDGVSKQRWGRRN